MEKITTLEQFNQLATDSQKATLTRLACLLYNGADLGGATPVEQIQSAENKIQALCFQWHNKHFRRVSYLFAVPNGGTRVMLEAMTLKATGTRKGVSDLILLAQDGNAYFIEMKTPSLDSVQSPEQKLFQAQIEQLGFRYYICRNLGQFKSLIYRLLDYAVEPGKQYS